MEIDRVEEDTVHYQLFPDDSGTESALVAWKDKFMDFARNQAKNYIWQKESFSLHLSTGQTDGSEVQDSKPHLYGSTKYGDNVEDEWFVICLIYELSKNAGITARVWDSDGEILLIQAAYALPRWLKPDIASNRVWIRGGKLHLIPLKSPQLPSLPSQPSLNEALKIVQSELNTEAPSHMQAAIASKLADYPEKIKGNMHNARIILPSPLASILQQNPQLLAPAVEVFYHRDPEDIKAARAMENFPADSNMVKTVVRFSRCLYAQMVFQNYAPPKSLFLPLPSDPDFPPAILGAKLMAAFEMLLASSIQGQQGENILRSKRYRSDWERYTKRLKSSGYFSGEIEGSARYKDLTAKAAQKFTSDLNTNKSKENGIENQDPANHCAELLAKNLPFEPEKVTLRAENDSWLAEGQDEIEIELGKHQNEAESHENQNELASKLKEFLGKSSELEGLDFKGDELNEGEFDLGSKDEGEIDFDMNSFVREMERALNLEDQEKISSDEGDSFYGEYLEDEKGDGQWWNQEEFKSAQDFSEAEHILNENMPSSSHRKVAGPSKKSAEGRVQKEGGKLQDESWEVQTETDSDDLEFEEENNKFDEAYEAALRAEYKQSLPVFHNENSDYTGEEDLTPVNLDMNLVQNLLSSYQAQEGLPGPSSNLAGMLGLQLH